MKRFLCGACLMFFLLTLTAEAATLYIDPSTAQLNRGDAITVSVRLDTDEAAAECINAVDGVLTYSESIIPVDVSIGESIFPVWVETPTINKENRTITFAGGIPNGYCGRVQGDPNLTNTVVELVFRSPGMQVGGSVEATAASVAFTQETTAYLNDGLGTKAELETFGTTFSLSSTVGSEIVDPWRDEVAADTVPPEAFSIALEQDGKTFGGKAYIVFNTTDKQTGISHYEVIEENSTESKLFRFGAANNPWVETRSPYVLKDQSLRSLIRVRAVDKAGNEYIATLLPDESMRTGSLLNSWYVIGAAVSALSIIVLVLLILWLRNRRKHEDRIQHNVESTE
jgi:hypothetical protein